MAGGTGNNEDELNRSMPAAKHASLGTLLTQLINTNNAELTALSCAVLSSPGLAIKAGASAIVKAATAFAAVVTGTLVRKAANTDMAALVGTLATAKSALWAFYIDAAGVLTTSAKTADANTHDLALALMPAVPAGKALIGWIVVDNATGSGFVGGTTALDTGSLTVTYYNSNGIQPLMYSAVGILGDINSR